MISNEMFGSDIIRVKINGYLKNNTENELITFNEKGIKNKEKIYQLSPIRLYLYPFQKSFNK